jgi:hypothetical protein
MEKQDTPSPSLRPVLTRKSSDSSDFSQSSSHGSSDDIDLPSSTCSWSADLIDKFGIKKVLKTPFDLVRTEWSFSPITEAEESRIDDIATMCSWPCMNFNSLEEIPYDSNKSFKQWVTEWFPKLTIRELRL